MRGKDYILLNNLKDRINNLDNSINELSVANIATNNMEKAINDEINSINKTFNKIDRTNKMRVIIHNIKIFGNNVMKVFPFLAAAVIAFGFHNSLTKDIPFIRQSIVKTNHYEETLDNLGNMETNSWYSDKPNDYSYVYKYDNWNNINNVNYRYYDEYPLYNFSVEDIPELINNPSKLEKLYGEYKVRRLEYKDELTEEDKKLDNYVQAIIRYDNKDESYTELQDSKKNMEESLYFMMWFVLLELGAFKEFIDISRNSREYLFNLTVKYMEIDDKDIRRQFHEKLVEYERLKNGNNQITSIDDIIDDNQSKRAIY